MTRQEFIQVLIRLNPNNRAALEANAWPTPNLPMISLMTAAHCFVNLQFITPQNEKDMQVLRDQLSSLETKGYFDFTD